MGGLRRNEGVVRLSPFFKGLSVRKVSDLSVYIYYEVGTLYLI